MPRRDDLESILIIGAGPIVIGQACEFDYSGTQACKALQRGGLPRHPRELEPGDDHDRSRRWPTRSTSSRFNWRTVAAIIAKERPDALLPTMGGQTALNCALDLVREGVLEQVRRRADRRVARSDRHGRGPRAVPARDARDRPRDARASRIAHSLEEALRPFRRRSAFPTIVRPSFTLGGSGGGIAYNREEFEDDRRRAASTLARPRGAGRGVGDRLERVRDGGGPRHARTTASSSARSRTSIRWACTPATRSPSRRRRR